VIDKWPDFTGAPEGGWKFMEERNPEFPTCHRPGGIGESQKVWLPVMLKKAQSQGTEVFFNTKAVQLVRNGAKGKVTAVIAQNADKTYTKFEAKKGICLCTGDYGYNKEMRKKYTPQAMNPTMVLTSMGEGHQMAMWVGGQMEQPPHAPMVHNFYVLGTDAFLQVNKYGKRFFNEDADSEHLANQAWEQDGIWVVFDDSWEEDIKFMAPGFKKWFRVNDKSRQEMKDMLAGKSGGQYGRKGIISANTIEELATKMKVPVESFKKTIARYNELVKLGKDLDYGKVASRMTAIDKPPYYAEWSPKPNWALVCMGGIIVNEKLQPVDKEGDAIQGLYLGGNTLGRRFKGGYPLVVPGISHSMAWTFGHLAGKYAAETV
jgi:fumarate reductase flavoprotein subunit